MRTLIQFGTLTMLLAFSAHAEDLPNLRVINSAVRFPEGPVFHEGILYYVGLAGSGVLSWDGRQNKTLFNDPTCEPTAVHPLGKGLVVACYGGNALVLIRKDGVVLKKVMKDSAGGAIHGPNDFAPDGAGGVYVTGSGSSDTSKIDGKVFHVTEDLVATEIARDIHFSNGIALSPDGKRLFVAEPEAQRVISFSTNPAGSLDSPLTDRRLFVRVDKLDPAGGIDAYPDGIKFGPDGNLWIGEYSRGRVAVFSGTGKFLRGYDLPGEQACTNIAFPADGKSVVATCVDDVDNKPYPGKVLMWSIAP